ncbi:DUF5367 family protein [uncultured Algibacter sp.]|uniref:DUF5367 family protein n=1 Tax=uncultured Algibacter sp. TaxID=298659 RepID=UPI0026092737|nr:DUF5367 family protein [uncultured Algibacter sp.]
MKTKRAILLGIAIWIIAILFYSISYSVSILEHADTQANAVLFMVVMPLVWFGCHFYYKKDSTTHGLKVGQTLLLTAVALDALITVPLFVIPNGGSHYSFFTSLGFWIIAFEFIAIATLYWYACVYSKNKIVKQ